MSKPMHDFLSGESEPFLKGCESVLLQPNDDVGVSPFILFYSNF